MFSLFFNGNKQEKQPLLSEKDKQKNKIPPKENKSLNLKSENIELKSEVNDQKLKKRTYSTKPYTPLLVGDPFDPFAFNLFSFKLPSHLSMPSLPPSLRPKT